MILTNACTKRGSNQNRKVYQVKDLPETVSTGDLEAKLRIQIEDPTMGVRCFWLQPIPAHSGHMEKTNNKNIPIL